MARLHYAAPFSLEELIAGLVNLTGPEVDTVTAWVDALYSPGSVAIRAGELGGALDNTTGYFTTRAWRAAEFPAANMVSDARSLARMYAATVSNVGGVRLLNRILASVPAGADARAGVLRPPGLPRIDRLRRPGPGRRLRPCHHGNPRQWYCL